MTDIESEKAMKAGKKDDWRSMEGAPPEADLERLQADAKRYLELAQRSQAELANAQARMRRDLDERTRYALEGFALELLPVIDSFVKAEEALTKAGAAASAIEAVALLRKELLRVFAKGGIRPIETQGRKFDAAVHEAVAMVTSAGHEDQAVVSEVRGGFVIGDRVLRPAQVVVARKPPGGSDGAKTEAGETAGGQRAPGA